MTELEQRISREMGTCVYFNGVFVNAACKAGVNYHELLGNGPGCFKAIPCLKDRNSTVTCPSREFPTRERAEEMVTAEDAILERFMKTIAAAKDDAKLRGFGIGNGGMAEIPCPNCSGSIRYSVASVNGHMHARCSTDGCASWME